MTEKENLPDLDLLVEELTGSATDDEGDAEYPLPEKKPVKFTGVDVIVMPRGYKSDYPKPEDSKPRFSDSLPSMKLEVDSAEETDGVLSVPVTVANAKHIYDYDGLKVRKPFEELEAAALFADGIPITREHPPAGIVTDRGQVLGFFRNPVAKNDLLKGILAITDKDLIADIRDEKLTEISAGFFCDLDESVSGELEGDHYDAAQKNIFLNHVAVVENGRCSIDDGCGIVLDATPVPQTLMDKLMAAIDRAKAMKDKSLLNMLEAIKKSISVEKEEVKKEKEEMQKEDGKEMDADKTKGEGDITAAKLKALAKALKSELNTMKGKLSEVVKNEKETMIKELEALQDSKSREDLDLLSLDELRKDLDMVKALKAKRLSAPDSGQSSGRTRIDDAYGKVGAKGGQ